MRKLKLEERPALVVACPVCGTQARYVAGTDGRAFTCDTHGRFVVGDYLAKQAAEYYGERN